MVDENRNLVAAMIISTVRSDRPNTDQTARTDTYVRNYEHARDASRLDEDPVQRTSDCSRFRFCAAGADKRLGRNGSECKDELYPQTDGLAHYQRMEGLIGSGLSRLQRDHLVLCQSDRLPY